jgi:hypothetical protein
MPYTKKQIIGFVKEGVSEELNTKLKNSNVTPARGAQAAVDAQKALKDLQDQVAALTKYVKEHLPPSSVGPTTTTGNGPATTTGNGPATTSGNGPATTSGTRGRRTGTRTRTSPTT